MSEELTSTLLQRSTSSGHHTRLLKDDKGSLYPLSLVAFFVWTAYTAALVFILEYIVSHPELYYQKYVSYVLQVAPGQLLTAFTQGHTYFTIWHLGRLGISSLDNRRFGPRTYLEMFWHSDAQWRKPLWVTKWWSAKNLKEKEPGLEFRGVSPTFFMFSFAFIVAFPTPYLLKRAYPMGQIDLHASVDHPYHPRISSLFTNSSNAVDPYTQLNIGQTAWEGGDSVEDMYPFRVFVPPHVNLDMTYENTSVLDDIMFSGDMDPDAHATLPGIRVQSSCSIQDISDLDLTVAVGKHLPRGFYDLCGRENLTSPTGFQWGPNMDMSFEMGYCHNLPTKTSSMEEQGQAYWNSSTGTSRDEMALVWVNLSDFTQTPATQGIVRCHMSTSESTSHISLRVDDPSWRAHFRKASPAQLFEWNVSSPEVPYWPPLLTALGGLSLPVNINITSDDNDEIATSQLFISKGKMLGYTLTDTWNETIQLYRKPSLEEASIALRAGALHMAAAINIGASTVQGQTLYHTGPILWLTRQPPYSTCAFVLLGVWFVTMLGLTQLLYGRAFASSMNSYAIAQICVGHPDLFETGVEGHADPHKNVQTLRLLRGINPSSSSSVEGP